jgi:Asp-tRNA(Asn)/Glu-tRNA(Gln) amidotransferase B subunit
LGELIKLIDAETISGKMAKSVFEEMFATGKPPAEIVEAKGLRQITSVEEIARVLEDVFAKNASQTADFVAGNDRLQAFFVGQVMKATGGSANPKKVNEAIAQALAKRRGS